MKYIDYVIGSFIIILILFTLIGLLHQLLLKKPLGDQDKIPITHHIVAGLTILGSCLLAYFTAFKFSFILFSIYLLISLIGNEILYFKFKN